MALINCPECGKEISDRAGECPHCGYPLSESDRSNESVQVTTESPIDDKTDDVESDDKFIGVDFHSQQNDIKPPKSNKKPNLSPVALGIISCSLIVVIVLGVIWFVNSPKTYGSAADMRKDLQGIFMMESETYQLEIDGIRARFINITDDDPESIPFNWEVEWHPDEGTIDIYYDSTFIDDNYLGTYEVTRNGDLKDTENGTLYRAGAERFTGEETEYPDGTEIYQRVLEIDYESAKISGNMVNPIGTITNTGKDTYTNIQIKIVFSDEDGYEVEDFTETIVPEGEALEPGESVKYNEMVKYSDQYDTYIIEIESVDRVNAA